MLRHLISQEQAATPAPTEGQLYKLVQIQGHSFPLIYGYYEECDRMNPAMEPMPIYPDFRKEPCYTDDGFPFVTQMQDVCRHHQGKRGVCQECAECLYYMQCDELIGVCTCPANRQQDQVMENS